MATYFPSPENQRETSNIIHLRESLPSSYSEGQVLQGNMMMYMNYASSSGAFSGMPGDSESNQSQQEMLSDFGGGSRIGDHDLNEWKDGRTGMLLMHPMGAAADVFHGPQNLQGGQGLSLTLSTHVPSGFQMPSFQCRNPDQGFSSLLSEDRNGTLGNHDSSPNKQSRVSEYVPAGFPGESSDPMRADASPYGRSGIARVIPNSKYLKAAQHLLDEVVNVKKAMKEQNSKNRSVKDSKNPDGGAKNGASETAGAGSSSNVEESSTNSPGELSAAEKQDLQNKMTKLLAMLDEVDRRYKQYYHQMQIVVSSFDVIAGPGAAKPYTALALQTISRHCRCLRDAINEQVQVTRKGLGNQDSSENSKGVGISRLRYVDLQIRQQKALQQLGMMQQHAWRPQRGLPETSVSILRAWLFEHFLHPYPKDSDKIMLARQTGLTRSQVLNWFINARVRLWKPMVEEMYKEEIGDGKMDINSSSDLATKPTNSEAKASDDRGDDLQQSTTSTPTERCNTGHLIESRTDHFTDTEFMEQNIDNTYQNANHHTEPENEYGLSGKSIVQSNEGNERLMAAYHMSELERFENGNNGVSLTLGLQQCEGSNNIPMSIETHQGYIYTSAAAAATSSMGSEATEFDCMDGGNRVIHHRFGSSHLLHDFVA